MPTLRNQEEHLMRFIEDLRQAVIGLRFSEFPVPLL